MNKEKDILNQLGNLPTLEPSAEWETRLFQKLQRTKQRQNDGFEGKAVWVIAAILLLINVLSFAQSWESKREKENNLKLSSIASEILINTGSAKY